MNTLDLFKDDTEFTEFRAGETIFREGEPGDSMYVVMEGSVDVMVGDEKFIVTGPGEILGEMALIDSSKRSATAIARKDCKLVPINEKRFSALVRQTPAFAIHVMTILAERLRRMNRILASII
ncbi:MAG: Crp/Fnr family transcriptional regulator [Gammaproteobacteria bacterium]